MDGCPLRISVGMKLPIAMVGRQIIRVMGEGFRNAGPPNPFVAHFVLLGH
jgi:hypothetical protein